MRGADMPLALPQRKYRALRILADRHTARVMGVKRSGNELAAARLDLRGTLVGGGRRKKNPPAARYARSGRVAGRRIVAGGLKERVHAFRHRHIDRGPAEHLPVKLFRAARSGVASSAQQNEPGAELSIS